MVSAELDEVDRAILHLLQQDARHQTPVDMAGKLSVSDGTVRNRIEGLEERGIIEGFVPTVDYETAGYPLKIVFICSAPLGERAELAERVLEVRGVVNVREMMTPRNNVRVVGIAADTDDITRIALSLAESGLSLEREELMRHEYVQPFDHFGAESAEELRPDS